MILSLTRSGKIATFVLGAFLIAFTFSGIADAQTRATASSGPCSPACTTGKSCYDVTGGSAPIKRCLTTAEAASYNTTDSPSAPTPTGTGATSGTLTNPLRVNSLEGLLGLLIDAAVKIGTIVLILALVYVGFLFVASRGSEEKIRDAKRYFFWIVIGGLLVLGAKGLSEVIKSTATSLGSGT